MQNDKNQIPSWSKSYFTDEDIKSLETTIKQIETKTTGELVLVINRRCTEHKLLPITLSLLFWITFENTRIIDLTVGQYGHATLFQIAFLSVSLLMGYLLSSLPIWNRWLTTAEERASRAWAAAELEFYRSKIQNTAEATGILVFVSLYEHQVIVLADKQISQKKPNETWDQLIAKIQLGIKSKNLSAGITEGLLQSGNVLSELFPAKAKNDNELPNAIVFRDQF
jgi:putative membrane protein